MPRTQKLWSYCTTEMHATHFKSFLNDGQTLFVKKKFIKSTLIDCGASKHDITAMVS